MKLGRTPDIGLWAQQPGFASEKALASEYHDRAKSIAEEYIDQGILSRHALHYSGDLAPLFIKAAKGLQILRGARG